MYRRNTLILIRHFFGLWQKIGGLHSRQLAADTAAGIVNLVAHNIVGGAAVIPWSRLRRVGEGETGGVDYAVITDQTYRHLQL